MRLEFHNSQRHWAKLPPMILSHGERWRLQDTRSPHGLTRLLLMPQQKYRPFSFLTRTWRRLLCAPRYELVDSICDLCSANPAPPLPVPGPQDSWALVTGPSLNRVYSKRAPHSSLPTEKRKIGMRSGKLGYLKSPWPSPSKWVEADFTKLCLYMEGYV